MNKDLTFNQFKKIAATVYSELPYENQHGMYDTPKHREDDEFFTWGAQTGGSSGASCWDDAPSVPFDTEPEWPYENPVKTLMKAIFKDLPEETMKTLVEDIDNCFIEEKNTDDGGDYYGNYITYSVKYIDLVKLWDFLEQKGLVNGS